MAKTITRQTLKLFGKDGATSNFGEFGSQAAGSGVTTKTISTIQSLTAWTNGWQDAVAAGQAPYLQDMNSLLYVLCYELCYQLQDGVADWDAGTSYYIGSVVRRTGTGELYYSLTDDNLNNALPTAGSSNTNWQFLSGIISSSYRIGGPLNMNSQLITSVAAATAAGHALIYEQVLGTLTKYRRPVLVWTSITTVAVESGIYTGVSGDVTGLFPDGKIVTVNSATLTTFNITRNAVLTNSGAQSGLRAALSEATNTWYALYLVRLTDNDNSFVTVGDTTLPLQANYATLNSAYGTGKWIYLGLIRNGDNAGATGDILDFVMSGHTTLFKNSLSSGSTSVGLGLCGTLLATTASATSLTYTTANGTGSAQIPNNIGVARCTVAGNTDTAFVSQGTSISVQRMFQQNNATTLAWVWSGFVQIVSGISCGNLAAKPYDIALSGFVDGVLGVGMNPIL